MSAHVRSGLSRLGLLLVVVALVVVVPVLTGAPRAAAAQASCTGNAMIFDARTGGQLWLYVNTAPSTGASSWSTVEQIGAGFNGLVKAGPNGDIYYITTAGLLRLYHFTGTGWTNAAGVTIGSGWQYYLSHPDQITIDSAGRIFVVDPTDTLREYHYNQQTNTWDNGAGDILDQGWGIAGSTLPALVVAAGDGLFFEKGMTAQPARYRYDPGPRRFTEFQNTFTWQTSNNSKAFTLGGDVVYDIDYNTGNLYWNHYNQDTRTWDRGGLGQVSGTGWTGHNDVSATTNTCTETLPAPVAPTTPVPAPPNQPPLLANGNEAPTFPGVLDHVFLDLAGHIQDQQVIETTLTRRQQLGTQVFSALSVNTEGDAQLAALDTNGQVWLDTGPGNDNQFSAAALHPVGMYFRQVFEVPSRLREVVGVDAAGQLWLSYGLSDGMGNDAGMSAWRRITTGNGLTSMAADSTGVFGLGTGSTAGLPWFQYNGSPFGPATTLTGTLDSTGHGTPTTGTSAFGLPIVGSYTTDTMQGAIARPQFGAPTTWSALPNLTLAAGPLATLVISGGETIVAAIGADGLVYVTTDQGAGTPFGPWQQVSTEPAGGPPTLFDPNVTELYLDFVGQDGNLYNFFSTLGNTPTTPSFGGGKVCPPSGC
jgi:hypothetical protein